jgi:hypothetical protein
MCTLSFAPTHGGCQLAMNRDESLSRIPALPPRLWNYRDTRALHPGEQDGGTWIGGNEHGLAAALLNWYSKPSPVSENFVSRGCLVPSLLGSKSLTEAANVIASMPLDRTRPFRLVAFSVPEQSIAEWDWCGRYLTALNHPWKQLHWFSSGFDEERANEIRSVTCKSHPSPAVNGFMGLHRSHVPEPGPFSICMHREDAQTVSCTLLEWTPAGWNMDYHDGPPCLGSPTSNLQLPASPENHSLRSCEST